MNVPARPLRAWTARMRVGRRGERADRQTRRRHVAQVDGFYSLIDSPEQDQLRRPLRLAEGLRGAPGPGLVADDVIAAARRSSAPSSAASSFRPNRRRSRAWASPPASRSGSSRRATISSRPTWSSRSSPARARGRLAGVNTTIPHQRPQCWTSTATRRDDAGRADPDAGHAADDVRARCTSASSQQLAALPGGAAGRTAVPHDARGHRPLRA